MAQPDQVMYQWIEEVRSATDAAFALSQRCRLIIAKAAANGLHAEPAPEGSDVNIETVRAAYEYIVKDMVALFDNAAVGKTDRTAINWMVNRGKGV